MVYILPYIEQNNIYKQWQFTGNSGAFNGTNNAAANGLVIKTYFCPSSPLPQKPATAQPTASAGSYAAISGAAAGLIPGFTETRISNLPCGGQISGGGVLFPNAQVTLVGITDGTSNTMAISEDGNFLTDNTGTKQNWQVSQPWGWYLGVKCPFAPPNFDNNGGDNREPNVITVRYQINYTPPGGWTNDTNGAGVGISGNCVGANTPLNSGHTGGVNALYCDGSVHFLTNGIALNVLAELATRDDGQPLPNY